MKSLGISVPVTRSPNAVEIASDSLITHRFPACNPTNATNTGLGKASWLGFVVGLCAGMSVTALLALTILGS